MRINRDILILPNATRVAFKSGAIVSDYSESSFPMCSIEVRKSAPRARILKAGARAIELTGETGNDVCHQGGCWIHLLAYPGDQTIDSVLCAESMDEGQAITLKVLEEAFGNYVTVDTANPDSGLR